MKYIKKEKKKSSQPTLGSEVSKIKFELPMSTSPILRHLEQTTPTGGVQIKPENHTPKIGNTMQETA